MIRLFHWFKVFDVRHTHLRLHYVRSQTRMYYRTYVLASTCWMSVLIVSKFATNSPNKIRTSQSIARWLDRCPIFGLRDVQTLGSPSTSKKIVKNNAHSDVRWYFFSSKTGVELAELKRHSCRGEIFKHETCARYAGKKFNSGETKSLHSSFKFKLQNFFEFYLLWSFPLPLNKTVDEKSQINHFNCTVSLFIETLDARRSLKERKR